MPTGHNPQALRGLVEALGDGDAVTRRHAAEDLGELGDIAALPALLRALEDPVVAVRESAADAVAAMGRPEAAQAAAGLLDSDEASLRNLGQEILTALGPVAVESLTACLGSPASDVRKFALDALGRIGEVSEIHATQLLCAMLGDPNINVAGAAAEALGRVGDKSALPALAARLDGEPWLQCCVLYAMARIGGQAVGDALAAVEARNLSPEVAHALSLAKTMLGQRQE